MVIVKGGLDPGGISPQIADKAGSDCGGTAGTVNRTLSIDHIALNELVFVAGAMLYPTTDYTKATVGGVTQYTFLNKIYNQFKIRIFYWI